MVEWVPSQGKKLRRLYDLCRRLGAPHFHSEHEMYHWIQSRLEAMSAADAPVSGRFVSAVREAKIQPLLRLANELYWMLVCSAFLERLKLSSLIKTFQNPLQIFPRSLHPNESAAY
jgi:hypothetical protein